tara:strand:+ start:1781 stop:1948 length:168 start_codon:yes stop_codon:yes gene_type:complete
MKKYRIREEMIYPMFFGFVMLVVLPTGIYLALHWPIPTFAILIIGFLALCFEPAE